MSSQDHQAPQPLQAPSLLLTQDYVAATSVTMAARYEQIPFDVCAEVPAAIEMADRKPYRAILVDFDLLGAWALLSTLSGHEQRPIGLALLPATAGLNSAFAAGFMLAIHKPLSLNPLRLGLKAAYEFGPARRVSPRAEISIPTLASTAREGMMRGALLNLSERGACLVLEHKVLSGTWMTVRFALPGASTMDLGARVVWDDGGLAGVQFHRLSSRHRAGIGAWVRGAIGSA